MQIRQLCLSDLKPIDDFWQKHHKGIYGIPERKFVVTDDVIDSGGTPIAYGIVRMFAEALLYIDKDISKFQQAKSFKLLMEKAIVDAKTFGLTELNVGVRDPAFADLLRRKYNFQNRDQILFLGL